METFFGKRSLLINIKIKAVMNKNIFFINLPYLGKDSFIIKKNVKLLISRFYPQVKPIFCFRTSFTIGSLFRVKDRIPVDLMSSVVYLYSCGQCTSSYVGQTSKQLKVRSSVTAQRLLIQN